MSSSKNVPMAIALMFASAVISGSLVFMGTQMMMSEEEFVDNVAKGVEKYIEAENEKTAQAASKATDYNVEAIINGPRVENISVDGDPVLGDSDAPVTIVEFSDYQCPYCQRFFLETYPSLKSEYIDTGLVKVVFKDFPLSIHADAQLASEAALCARDQGDDETYFEYHDAIFLGDTSSLDRDVLSAYAGALGLNLDTFNSCLDSGKYTTEVEEDLEYGISLGVTGTPAFFINGLMVEGAQPFSVFEKVIESELE